MKNEWLNPKFKVILILVFLAFTCLFLCVAHIYINMPQKTHSNRVNTILQVKEEWRNVSIFMVEMNTSGYIEIGQSLEMSTLYTLNASWDVYSVTSNWFDLENYVLDQHFLPYYVEDHYIAKIISLDPEIYDPSPALDLRAHVYINLEEDLTGWNYGYQNWSGESIRIFKADLAYEVLEQFPEVVFQENETNIAIQFYNEHDSGYKFRNQLMNCSLLDPDDTIISEQNVSTDLNGTLNLTLDTDNGKTGIHRLLLNNIDSTDYNELNLELQITVLDSNNSFNVWIPEANNSFPIVDYDEPEINIQVLTEFSAQVYCQFDNNSLLLNSSDLINHYTTIPSSQQAGLYDLILRAVPLESGYNLTKIIPLSIRPRPVLFNLTYIKNPDTNHINFSLYIFDNHSNHSIMDGEIVELFYYQDPIWSQEVAAQTINGWVNLSWNLPMNLPPRFFLDLRLNSDIYVNQTHMLELIPSKITSIVPLMAKILTRKTIKFVLQTKDGVTIKNEPVEILINGLHFMNQSTSNMGQISFTVNVPESLAPIHISFLFYGNDSILGSKFECVLIVTNDLVGTFLSNSGILVSTIVMGVFSVIIIRRKKYTKNLNKLKMK